MDSQFEDINCELDHVKRTTDWVRDQFSYHRKRKSAIEENTMPDQAVDGSSDELTKNTPDAPSSTTDQNSKRRKVSREGTPSKMAVSSKSRWRTSVAELAFTSLQHQHKPLDSELPDYVKAAFKCFKSLFKASHAEGIISMDLVPASYPLRQERKLRVGKKIEFYRNDRKPNPIRLSSSTHLF